jgi:uncharacterized membrane protein YjjP (DUF1212 family)
MNPSEENTIPVPHPLPEEKPHLSRTPIEEKEALDIAMLAGEILLQSSAETYRVEDTIQRLCREKGVEHAECFVTPTAIVIGNNMGEHGTRVKRIRNRSTNLGSICAVNRFSYGYRHWALSYEQTIRYLKSIKNRKIYPGWLYILVGGLSAAFLSLTFGGRGGEFLATLITATVSVVLTDLFRKLSDSDFLRRALGGLLIGLIGLLFQGLIPGLASGIVVTSAMVPFLPGTAFTNGLRDLLAGDLLSGVVRLIEALLMAASLAIGVGITLSLHLKF